MSISSSDASCPDFSTIAHGFSYSGPPVTPNPEVSGLGVFLPFPLLLWSHFVPRTEALLCNASL